MPSSTSSFNRPVPDRPWLRLGLIALILAVSATLGWEMIVRSWGYGVSYNDTPDLWALHRDQVEPDSTVIVGSSRVMFDLDLDVFEEHFGERPIQLAIVGSAPRETLFDLTSDPNFEGTILVGYVPNLFFAPGGPTVDKTNEWLAARGKRSPSSRIGHAMGRRLEAVLAFLNSEDLSLKTLTRRLEIPNRSDVFIPPANPPYLARTLLDRQGEMTERLATDTAFQEEIQTIWRNILTSLPPMEKEAIEQIRQGILAGTAAQVTAFRERGGTVVFLRMPSTGFFREFEMKTAPRELYWDKLLEMTKSHGLHFEDELDLRDWDCPEWSHLTKEDSTHFSEKLVPILDTILNQG